MVQSIIDITIYVMAGFFCLSWSLGRIFLLITMLLEYLIPSEENRLEKIIHISGNILGFIQKYSIIIGLSLILLRIILWRVGLFSGFLESVACT